MKKNNNKKLLLHPNDHKREKDWEDIFEFMDERIDYGKIKKSLDLGSGRGDMSRHILRKNPSVEAICVDVDLFLLEEAEKSHKNIKIFQYDINKKLPFEDNSIDMVSCLGTLHYPYIVDAENLFSEITRISKKYVVVDFMYKFGMWRFLLDARYPKYNPRRYTDGEIKHFFQKYNLKANGSFGTRSLFGNMIPSSGRITVFVLEKQNE